MTQVKQTWTYLRGSVTVTGKSDRAGTYGIRVRTDGGTMWLNKDFDDEVDFNAALRSIKNKIQTLDDYFKELNGG